MPSFETSRGTQVRIRTDGGRVYLSFELFDTPPAVPVYGLVLSRGETLHLARKLLDVYAENSEEP